MAVSGPSLFGAVSRGRVLPGRRRRRYRGAEQRDQVTEQPRAQLAVAEALEHVLPTEHSGEQGEVGGLRSLAHGFVSLELSGALKHPVDREESLEWLISVFIDGLEARAKQKHRRKTP
jgi:Tetracyclin repressor-like, C-terminal domain